MTDPTGRDPDPAALDELLRAFGEEPEIPPPAPVDEPVESDEPDVAPDVESDGSAPSAGSDDAPVESELEPDLESDAADEPAEIVIVEQEPMVEPADVDPTPPSIIRIDDYSGSAVIEQPVIEQPVSAVPPTGDSDAHPDVAGDEPVVIAIAGDDLPDTVYVEGELDPSSQRTIVFIEDDDTGDTLAPDAERDVRRGIEPRLRERRAAVKRAIGRKRLRWLLLGTVVIVVGVGALALMGSGLFAIKAENVDVFGAVYADPDVVDAVVDDLVGTPALRVDTKKAEAALESIPWVDEARVRVSFPHTATIEIRERAAQTTYQGPDQRYRVLDRDGRVLAVRDGYPIAYVLLNGPDPVDLDPGEFAPQGYAAASELAKNLTTSIRGRVSSISVAADGSQLSLFLDDGTEVRFGAARDLFNKLLRLETTLARNPEREPGVIDVSTSEVTL